MKNVLVVAALAMLSTGAFAQVKLGVKLGLNISNLKVEGDAGDSKIGPLAGVMAEFPLSDKFSFRPEAVFSIEGYKESDKALNANYLNIPLMAKYNATENVFVFAGPQVGLLVSATYDGDDTKDSFKGLNLGLGVGAGYELESGFGADLRYNIGLSDISDVDGTEVKASTIQLGVFYKF